MEVKIGIQQAARELVVETDAEADTVEKQVAAALEDGSALALTDTKGRRILVPGAKIAYVEIGGGVAGHVGFLRS
ncbi:DUF3107 domain-containing protein [Nocardioides sp. Bht2]|uniref:DUF3107 domain-containing protein n=1 Tax=Nocardioides sp. Bht2 TaxID=3392297 RepID=UPI0039B586CE